MPDRWAQNFGSSINPYLPLLAFRPNNLAMQPAYPGKFECVLFNHESKQQQYQNNFHQSWLRAMPSMPRACATGLTAWESNSPYSQCMICPLT